MTIATTLIVSLSGHRELSELRAAGTRARSGPLSMLAERRPDSCDVAVAYALTARGTTAVQRNTMRRRLRVLVRAAVVDGRMGPGRYLISVAPPLEDLDSAKLARHLDRALAPRRTRR